MKTINEIKDDFQAKRSLVFEKHGVFFAFGPEQIKEGEERTKPKSKLVGLGYSAFCPQDNVNAYLVEMDLLIQEEIKLLTSPEHRKEYIVYELYNHESFYTGDIQDAYDAVSGLYSDITLDEVYEAYVKEISNYEKHNN